jgi:hypothetical protein
MSNPVPDAAFLRVLLSSGWPAIRHFGLGLQLLRYAREIKRRARSGEFHFYTREEAVSLLETGGFSRTRITWRLALAETVGLVVAQKGLGISLPRATRAQETD